MYRRIALGRWGYIAAAAAMALWLLLIAFAHPVSHDESQYVAATDLVSGGLLPYRDFAYLQTPLQPLVFAPLDWLIHERLFLVSRIANALLALASVLFVNGAARRLGATARAALAASAMLLACHAFLWAAGVARNDMLPAALFAAALWTWLGAAWQWKHFAVGLALGLAASAKISYAVPAVAIAVTGLLLFEADKRRDFLWLALGEAAGILPIAAMGLLAPRAFFFEAITFPAYAPDLFYNEIGKHWRVGEIRYLHIVLVAAIGPALIAAVEIARRCLKRPQIWIADPKRRILFAATAGGLLSAALNRPFNTPYLVPALIPLFVLAAMAFSEAEPIGRPMRWSLAVSTVAGILPALAWIGLATAGRGWPALVMEKANQQLGDALQADHVRGPVASLRDDYLVDSRYPLDPAFAAGPFLFRTLHFVPRAEAIPWKIVTRDQAADLSAAPPSAIVTGLEPGRAVQIEARLVTEAERLGYTPAVHVGNYVIWTRPNPGHATPVHT